MNFQSNVTFQEAIETVENLPEYQQEDLINIIRRRIMEHSRDLLAKSIEQAKREYSRGEVNEGTVNDLMKDLSE